MKQEYQNHNETAGNLKTADLACMEKMLFGNESSTETLKEIRSRLETIDMSGPFVAYKFSLSDEYSVYLFETFLRNYGFEPYRNSGQRLTTVMVKIPHNFVKTILWPEFNELDKKLKARLMLSLTELVTEWIINTPKGSVPKHSGKE